MNIPHSEETKKHRMGIPATLWLLFLAFHAIIVFAGPKQSSEYSIYARNWGFDLISYYSLPWIILFYTLCILFCIPAVNRWFMESLNRVLSAKVFQIIGSKEFLKLFVFIIVGFASVGIFWFFRIKYNFLGDMNIRVEQTLKQEFVDTEALTMWLIYYVYKILNATMGLTGTQTFQWVSYISGAMYIIILLFLADKLIEERLQKVLFVLFSASAGTMQIFFGYTEIYCLPAVSILFYILTGILFIRGEISVAVPLITFCIAVGMHILSVALLPSLFVMIAYPRIGSWISNKRITVLHFILLLLVCIPIVYIVAPILGVNYFLIPIMLSAGTSNIMTLFSSEHLWEYMNSQMLAAGTSILLLLFILFLSITRKLKYDLTLWFLATGSLGMLYFSFLTNAVRGSVDWDIYSFPAIVFNVFCFYVLLDSNKLKLKMYRFQYMVPMLLLFNGLSTAAWIGINTSDRSIAKIEHMTIGDPGNNYQIMPDIMSLGAVYEFNGLEEKSMECMKKAYELYPKDPRTHFNYAFKLSQRGELDKAQAIYENLLNIAPEYPNTYDELLKLYVQKDNSVDQYRIVNKLFYASIKNPKDFSRVIGTEKLKYVFSKLRDYEKSTGNIQKAHSIEQELSRF